jgi:hypothetical protein
MPEPVVCQCYQINVNQLIVGIQPRPLEEFGYPDPSNVAGKSLTSYGGGIFAGSNGGVQELEIHRKILYDLKIF